MVTAGRRITVVPILLEDATCQLVGVVRSREKDRQLLLDCRRGYDTLFYAPL